MKSKSLLLSVSMAALLTTSCERQTTPYAKAKPQLGAPEYAVTESVSRIPAAAFVEEIAPKGGVVAIDGAALFAQSCSACHQATGAGIPGVFPPLDKSPYVVSDNVERMASIMLYGLSGPINVLGTTYQSAMAPLGAQFKDEELAAIATHVRTSWSNKAGPVDAKVFAAMRQKWGSRGPFAIAELGEEK